MRQLRFGRVGYSGDDVYNGLDEGKGSFARAGGTGDSADAGRVGFSWNPLRKYADI